MKHFIKILLSITILDIASSYFDPLAAMVNNYNMSRDEAAEFLGYDSFHEQHDYRGGTEPRVESGKRIDYHMKSPWFCNKQRLRHPNIIFLVDKYSDMRMQISALATKIRKLESDNRIQEMKISALENKCATEAHASKGI